MRLDRRLAVVTGAAQGIGKAIAECFAAAGARLALVDIQREAAEQLADALRDVGKSNVLVLEADLTEPDEVRRVIPQVHDKLGTIQILVNNAAIFPARRVEEITTEEWDRVMAINLKAAFMLSQAAMPDLVAAGRAGRLINISSGAAKTGALGAHYAASKAGVIAMTKAFATELAVSGATANVIAPGPVRTDDPIRWAPDVVEPLLKTTPLGRLGEPSDVANAALFLASDLAGFITGEVVDVDGGRNMD
ncbi:SDR family NAD(P)-dependent oxidoreductase [Chloroflexota bacterium]